MIADAQASLIDCMTRVRTAAAIGGALVAAAGADRMFPYSPMVHHALAGVVAEYSMGRLIPPVMMTAPYFNQKGVLDTSCAALTGIAAGWAAKRAQATLM